MKTEQFIVEAWRQANAKRAERGASRFTIHDRELFCLGLYAAASAIVASNATAQDISETAGHIEGKL